MRKKLVQKNPKLEIALNKAFSLDSVLLRIYTLEELSSFLNISRTAIMKKVAACEVLQSNIVKLYNKHDYSKAFPIYYFIYHSSKYLFVRCYTCLLFDKETDERSSVANPLKHL